MTGGGLSGTSLLLILFVGLKLLRAIDWSWWWVLSPAWISAALVIFIVGVVAGCAVLQTRGDQA